MDLNRTQLLGNLTAEPELKQTPKGQSVCTFTVATNKNFKVGEEWKQETEFHNCVAWNKTAEFISLKARKGDKVYVEGSSKTRSWNDKTGNKRYRTELMVSMFELMKKQESKDPQIGADVMSSVKEVFPEADISIDDLPF